MKGEKGKRRGKRANRQKRTTLMKNKAKNTMTLNYKDDNLQ